MVESLDDRYKFRVWEIDKKYMHYNIRPGSLFFNSVKKELCCLSEIHPYKVMLNTGLKDKKGECIYEGDFLDMSYDNLYICKSRFLTPVVMEVGSDSDGWCHEEWLGWMANTSSVLDIAEHSKILGNLYEDPDLGEE